MKSSLNSLLAPHHLEYVAINAQLWIVETSEGVGRFAELDTDISPGNYICEVFPELWGTEEILAELLDGQLPNFEFKAITRVQSDGALLYFDLYISPYLEDPNSPQLIIFLEDVTSRMALEQTLVQATNETNLLVRKLETTQAYVEKIISCMAEALVVTNLSGIIKTVNKFAENLLGYSEAELIGKPIATFISDESFSSRVNRYFAATNGEPLNNIEVACKTKGGMITVAFSCSLIQTEITQISSSSNFSVQDVVYIGRDITERKRSQQRQILQYITTLILADAASLEQAIEEILPVICETLGWEVAQLWMTQEWENLVEDHYELMCASDQDFLHCVSHSVNSIISLPKFIDQIQKTPIKLGEGIIGNIWKNASCEWIYDLAEDSYFSQKLEGDNCLKSAFGFPILGDYEASHSARKVLGVIIFFSQTHQPIDEPLLQTMAALGSQIGQFIKRKQAEAVIRIEQEKSEKLLLNILPKVIADRLKGEENTIAEYFAETTVLFADLVGFTPLSASMSPIALVNLLNQLFSAFDHLSHQYGLEKIKTIGDAYMVVGGIPISRPDHAVAIAMMALEMQNEINKFNTRMNKNFTIRIGIHSGPVVAGVIGIKKFIYDLWGDTVNLASRMESHSLPGKIQVSDATYELLKDQFFFEERGLIEVKGRGEINTYFLVGKRGKKKEEISLTPSIEILSA